MTDAPASPGRRTGRLAVVEALAWMFLLTTPFMERPVGAVALLLLAAALPVVVFTRGRGRVPTPLLWFGALATYQLLSAAVFGMPLENFLSFEFLRRDGKFYIAYLPLVVAALIYVPEPVTNRMLRVLLAVIGVLAIWSVFEYVLAMAGVRLNLMVHGSQRGHLFLTGIAQSHNAVGGYFAVVASLMLGQMLVGAERGRRAWVLLGAMALAMVLTLSRAFILGFVVAGGLALLVWGDRRMISTASLVGLLALPLAGGGLADRVLELRNAEDLHNARVRIEYWTRAVHYIRESPLLGIGYSRFNDEPAWQLDGIPHVVSWKVDPPVLNSDAHAHNGLLMAWAETGLLGVVLWLGFLGSMFRTARMAYLDRRLSPTSRGIGLGVTIAFGVILVASLVANNIVTPSSVWLAGFFAGLMMTLRPTAAPTVSET